MPQEVPGLENLVVEDTPKGLREKVKGKSRTEAPSHRSDKSYTSSYVMEDCPPVYEEIIQGLEADVRKHIRIEHQLKLHIESVEDRVEELERELDRLDEKSESRALDELRLLKEQMASERDTIDTLTDKL